MQEDPETLLALQRANIVAQYHQAHQAGSPQDLSLCKVTDHQGFLQDKELPGPSPREAKKLRQETRCADKWIKMLKQWDRYLPSEKLRRLVYKGVPPQVRGQVCLRLLNVDQVKARNARKYQGLPAGNEGGGPGLLPGHHADRPGRQLHVPQSHHVLGPLRGRRALFHVLAACSVYDTEVGYCQGMSEIAAILLMFLPEEDAFWALAQLMTNDRHAMHGAPSLTPKPQRGLGTPITLPVACTRCPSGLGTRLSPRRRPLQERGGCGVGPEHLLPSRQDEEQMSTGIYTPKWFLQCFLGQTSQARPRGPEAEARSPAHPAEAQRVPGRGAGARAVSASAPPGEAGSARGVDGPSAHRAASLGSS
ncbi:TBC1 domain family member 26-like [Canis aureus]